MYRIGYIKDVMGNNYLGIKYNENNEHIVDNLNKMKNIIGEEDYELFTNNQQRRDSGHYHTTILNVMEYNRCSKEMGNLFMQKVDRLLSIDIFEDEMNFVGLGKADDRGNTAYFIVIKSEILDEVRKSLNLPPKDFHITIGFDRKDVFTKPKDEKSLVQ